MLVDALKNNWRTKSFATKNYWEFYGLSQNPFAPLASDKFFCLLSSWEQQFDLLNHLCHSVNALLAVTASTGSGKTTFLHQYLTQLGEGIEVCQLAGSSDLTITRLQTELMQTFHLPPITGDTLEEQLDFNLSNLQHCKNLCLLVIDDAEKLPSATLEVLLYYIQHQSTTQMRLHIIIFGLPELNNRLLNLTQQAGDAGLLHCLEIMPFTLAETTAYLQHRLVQAGLPAAMPFNQAEIKKIHKLAEGHPVEINFYAQKYLMANSQKNAWQNLSNFIQPHKTKFLGGLVLFIGLFAVAIIFGRNSHYPVMPVVYHPVKENISRPVMASLSAGLSPITSRNLKPQVPANSLVATKSQPVVVANTTVKPITVNKMQPAKNTVLATKSQTIAVANASVKPIATNNIQPTTNTGVVIKSPVAVAITTTQSPKNPVVVAKTQLPAPAFPVKAQATVKPVLITETKLPVKITREAKPAKVQQINKPLATAESNVLLPTASKKIPQKTSKKSTLAYVRKSGKNNSLLNANPENFTIQLIGLSSEKAIHAFINKNNLNNKATYFHSKLQGRDWYVLLYGQYKTSQDAKIAITKLPAAVQAEKPWVRTMANVQLSLNRAAQ